MLIDGTNIRRIKLDILIGLVMAMFIITAIYVGYQASHDVPAKGHDIEIRQPELYDQPSIVPARDAAYLHAS